MNLLVEPSQFSIPREKMSVDGWLLSLGIKNYCCVWCMKDVVVPRIQFKHFNKRHGKRKLIRSLRDYRLGRRGNRHNN